MIDALPLLLGPEGYQISRSVRLRSSASAYFNRTLTTPTDAKKWTWSGWVKRGILGASPNLFWAWSGSGNEDQLMFSTDTLRFYVNGGTTGNIITSAVFRDPSAWYHIIAVYDSANATSNDRMILYVNGVRQTLSTNTQPTLNYSNQFNTAVSHSLGRNVPAATYFDGYLTEVNFIDGQALTPSSFGVTNAYGVWSPTKYNGTYGTNGFYLNFSDNSAATAAAIGKDYSGNGNNWTPNNISVTAGVTYDSMLDVPTQWADGGNGRGNYAVLNPIAGFVSMTVSDGNLRAAPTLNTGWHSKSGTMAVSSGKWYAEFSMPSITSGAQGNPVGVGIVPANTEFTGVNQMVGDAGRGYGFYCPDTAGNVPVRRVSGTNTSVGTGSATSTTDVFMVAFDLTSGTGWFGKNGTWYAGDPAAGTGASITGIVAADYVFGVSIYRDNTFTNNTAALNFGQRSFAYTPPSGFKALNTLNLPTPTILKGNQYFDATLYTGNGTGITVTNSGSMQPDFVWAKNRSNVADHALYDALRTAMLSSNTTAAEVAASNVVSYNSNGFTISGGDSRLNANGNTYVGWQWKEGATQGFDIVLYTGNGGTQNISHNLGVAPRMMIVKSRSVAQRWTVYHASVSNAYLYLNETFAADTANAALRFGNNSAVVQPTSSVFTIGNSVDVNQNTTTYVAYLFAEVAGFSKFGSYTGNGSADGPFVLCGFRPRFVMWKKTTGVAADWDIIDTSRNVGNIANSPLYPNLSSAETTVDKADILSNGFKLRTTSTDSNVSGETYIFAAFAENPFKNSLAR